MRRATEQSLSIPAFRTPADCTPWVLGGLWPAELEQVNPETASLAEYLKNDLQRIANSANDKLRVINEAALPEPVRLAEETRVINVARAFAVLRVESTVRHLRNEPLGFQPEYLSLGAVPDEPTVVVAPPPDEPTVVVVDATEEPREAPEVAEADEPTVTDEADVAPKPVRREEAKPPPPVPPAPTPPPSAALRPTRTPAPPPPRESAEHRLRRLVEFVARQEPGLRWAVADRADGTTVLATDLASGWIPSGIDLPAGVELMPPQRRSGNLAAILGPTERVATYQPGDAFSGATTFDVTVRTDDASAGPRAAPPVEDLGWQLTDATHWRDGLPRMAHTMAKAGAAGTGVVDAELDVLRVHLDTARYQLLAQYPGLDAVLLGNTLLLAATEAIAAGDREAANYHFAWFLELSAPAATEWRAQS